MILNSLLKFPLRPGLCVALLLLSVGAAAQPLDTMEVRRGTLTEPLRLDGVIEAVQHSTVSAQTSGTVVALPVDVDDVVAAGDLIVQLEDSEQRARLAQAQAELDGAAASVQDAQQQLDRIEPLAARGVASQAQLDQARNAVSSARARLARAQAAREEAAEQLSYTRVRAPYSGIVTERHVELGEAVTPSTSLLSGFSLDALRVVANIPQQHAGLLRQQRSARVLLADGKAVPTGAMTIFPFAEAGSHTFKVRMDLQQLAAQDAPPPLSLFPGMLVKVEVPVTEREALWIPASALIQRSELRAVYVMDEHDRPRLRQVRVGVHLDDQLEILAGLMEGERLVLDPRAALRQLER